MIYIVDHQDSFTWNVVHQFSEFNDVYCSNYFDINKKMLDKADTSTCRLYNNYKGKKKMIGICLGYQQILYCEKVKIVQQKRIYHGYQSEVKIVNNKSIFSKKMKFKVGRYHSLKLKEPFFSKNFEITMRCSKTNIAMAFENKIDDIYGFQFHPESFLTTNGKILIKKILSA